MVIFGILKFLEMKYLDKHLKHHGYELHEEGHITKKMQLDKSLGVKKDRTGSSWL